MRYAIIAAGEGSRLASEGIKEPKPLVEVNGEKLIDRLIRIFMDNDAEEIVVICNDKTTLVSQHLYTFGGDHPSQTTHQARSPHDLVVAQRPLHHVQVFLKGILFHRDIAAQRQCASFWSRYPSGFSARPAFAWNRKSEFGKARQRRFTIIDCVIERKERPYALFFRRRKSGNL